MVDSSFMNIYTYKPLMSEMETERMGKKSKQKKKSITSIYLFNEFEYPK